MKNTRVPNHSLAREGMAHDDHGESTYNYGGPGRAKCSCGELSPPLSSGYARKNWHRDHKAEKVSGAS